MREEKNPAILCRDVRKAFGPVMAVQGLNLQVFPGELYALLGVNGAGKTTTIKLLTGLLRPDGGTLEILGKKLPQEMEAMRRITAVSPQETAVAGLLTVRENLELMARVHGLGKKEGRKRASDTINALGLQPVKDRRAKTLSGCWQRRLSIAMALIGEPQVLYLDEPTLGLDVLARRELWREVESLKGKTTIVLTTHYMEEAQALSDRVGIMAGGRLLAEGTVEELCEKTGGENLEEAFVRLVEEELERTDPRSDDAGVLFGISGDFTGAAVRHPAKCSGGALRAQQADPRYGGVRSVVFIPVCRDTGRPGLRLLVSDAAAHHPYDGDGFYGGISASAGAGGSRTVCGVLPDGDSAGTGPLSEYAAVPACSASGGCLFHGGRVAAGNSVQ